MNFCQRKEFSTRKPSADRYVTTIREISAENSYQPLLSTWSVEDGDDGTGAMCAVCVHTRAAYHIVRLEAGAQSQSDREYRKDDTKAAKTI